MIEVLTWCIHGASPDTQGRLLFSMAPESLEHSSVVAAVMSYQRQHRFAWFSHCPRFPEGGDCLAHPRFPGIHVRKAFMKMR